MTSQNKTSRLRLDARYAAPASLVLGLIVLGAGVLLARKTATNNDGSMIAWLMITLGIIAIMAACGFWTGAYSRET